MTLRSFLIAGLLWAAAEVAMGFFRRARGGAAQGRDRGSMALIYATIALSLSAGMALAFWRQVPIPLSTPLLLWIALGLLVAGVLLRVTAVVALGRLFTMNVAIQADHRLVRTGLYRRLRHPSYTGALIGILAIGLSFGDFLALAVAVLPITAAMLYRIRVEEEAMVDAFGEEYLAYRRDSWRLLPGIY